MNSTTASHKNSKPEFAAAGSKVETVQPCPACSCTRGFEVRMASVYECAACHALYGRMYLGDSYTYVMPQFARDTDSADVLERQRYFDFDCVGSKGLSRRHGWFDPQTKLLTQVG